VTLYHNKHISGYQHYFDAIGFGHAMSKYQFNPEWNYIETVNATSAFDAISQVMSTLPFMTYLACKYREKTNAVDRFTDPKSIFDEYGRQLLQRYHANMPDDVEEEYDETLDLNIYYRPLFTDEHIRNMFTPNELLMIEKYARSDIKWDHLSDEVSELYERSNLFGETNPSIIDRLTPEEWEHLITTELTYGSIDADPL